MTRKPRVLILHHSGLLGGAGKSLSDLVLGLRDEFDLSVHVPEAPSELIEWLRLNEVRASGFSGRMAKVPFYSGGEKLSHPRFWYYALSTLVQAKRWRALINAEDPDVVVLNSGVLAWMALLVGTRPTVLLVRETLSGTPNSSANRIIRAIRRRSTLVAYLSDYDRNADALRGPRTIVVRDADAHAPSPAVSKASQRVARRRLGVPESKSIALFLGGSNRLKGLDLIASAMTFVPSGAVHVIVAGRKPEPSTRLRRILSAEARFDHRVLSLIERSNLSATFTFVGTVGDVDQLYGACDFVLFQMWEPHQSRPAFEAGWFGKPIVITNFPNVRECVVDGKNGFTFERGNATELAKCIVRAAREPSRRTELGEANREHAATMHSHASVYSKFVEELKSLAEPGVRSRGSIGVEGKSRID